jgi:hypothetical protein
MEWTRANLEKVGKVSRMHIDSWDKEAFVVIPQIWF